MLEAGRPLLRGRPLLLDQRAFRTRWEELAEVLEQHEVPNAARLSKQGPQELEAWISLVLQGDVAAFHVACERCQLDAGMVGMVLRLCLLPVLARVAERLASSWQGSGWSHGYCPICGSWPLIAELRGLEQRRYLRCGLCTTGWEFQRLGCPYCANRDHHTLGYLHIEGQENQQRIATCEVCRGYVKTLACLDALAAPALLTADLRTLDLDLIASERGYTSSGLG